MNDARSAAARTRDGATPPAALNALWIGGAASLDQKTADLAFERLVEAAKLASSLWPEFYQGEGLARLVHDAAAPPPPAIAAAAQRCGMALAEIDLAARSGAGQCDVALASLAASAEDVGALPLLSAAKDGGGGLALYSAPSLLFPTRRPAGASGAASAAAIARAIFSPPRRSRETAKLREYQNEEARAAPARFEYDLLLRAIGEPLVGAAAPDHGWSAAQALAQAAGPASAAAIAGLRAEYDRADAQALAYGRRWRSTLAARSFLLLLGIVMSGLVGALFPSLVAVTVPVQVFATALIFVDRRFARRRRWREKWIEYRRLAESARIARFCLLAGAPFPGSGAGEWLDWRLRRALRCAPPVGAIDEKQARDALDHLRVVEIADQIAYHHGAFRRFRRLDARLKRAAAAALFSTMALGAVFALLALAGRGAWTIPLTAALSLALSAAPGLYAALDGLRVQLDVARQAQRSGRIAAGLRRLARELSDAPPSAALARAAALRAAAIMGEDVASWEQVVGIV